MIVPLTPLEFRQRAASLFGSKIGIVDGQKRFTYGEYDQRVNRFANALTKIGVGKGDVVSFITYNSHQLLEAAFSPDPPCEDRVFLLSLGLEKSIKETYNIENRVFISSMGISLEKLVNLYHNISHLNWRLKVYRDEQNNLLFITNEAGEDGYINMGYEIIMTEIMTRIKDDIFLRGGTPPKLLFNMSTIFLSIVL